MTSTAPAPHVEADRCVLVESGDKPAILPLSPHTLAARHWPRGAPDLLGLERAIDDVENAIENAGLHHADRGTLFVTPSMRDLLQQWLDVGTLVSRGDVEAVFSNLVASAGSSLIERGSRAQGVSAAALLLLREVMHHLGFQTVGSGD